MTNILFYFLTLLNQKLTNKNDNDNINFEYKFMF